MAVFQIESGICNGRGFVEADANGFLANFYTWVTKSPGSGGPGWYILRDKSIYDLQEFTVDHTTEIFTAVNHGYTTGDQTRISTTGTVPSGLYTTNTYYVIKINNDTFYLADRLSYSYDGIYKTFTDNGTGTHSIRLTGPYIIVSDVDDPATPNTVCKILKIGMNVLDAGYIEIFGYLGWNEADQYPIPLWFGRRIPTLDDADFAYDFRGGEEQMIIQSRIGTDWYNVILDEFIGDSSLLESTDKNGTTQEGMSAGDDVTVEMGTGEGSKFTAGNYYYMYNFAYNWIVQYIKVTKVGTGDGLPSDDHIQLEHIEWDRPTGAIISAYSHRFYSASNVTRADYLFSRYKTNLPYVSDARSGYLANSNQYDTIYCDFKVSRMLRSLLVMAPNDLGLYAVQKPSIIEHHEPNLYSGYTGMNRGYGMMKNIYVTNLGSMAKGQDGRVINGNGYLYFVKEYDEFNGGDGYLAVLFQDFESES